MTLMKVSRVRCRVAASAALLVVVAAGCDGGSSEPSTTTRTSTPDQPTTSNTAGTSSSAPRPTSARYTPEKPTYPAAAKEKTEDGAVAFVRYFWSAVNFAYTAPDKSILLNLSEPSCDLCNRFIETASDLSRGSQKYDAKLLDITQTSVVVMSEKGTRVRSRIKFHPAKAVDSTGQISEEQEEGQGDYLFKLHWAGSSWRIVALGAL